MIIGFFCQNWFINECTIMNSAKTLKSLSLYYFNVSISLFVRLWGIQMLKIYNFFCFICWFFVVKYMIFKTDFLLLRKKYFLFSRRIIQKKDLKKNMLWIIVFFIAKKGMKLWYLKFPDIQIFYDTESWTFINKKLFMK